MTLVETCAPMVTDRIKPTLLARETMALEAFRAALGIVIEPAVAPGEAGLYYVIDTNRAEPEVNHPGELVAGPVTLDVAIAFRNQRAAREILEFAGEPTT